MKKTVAVLLVVALALICFGCAKAPTPLGEADVTVTATEAGVETTSVTQDPAGLASFIGKTVKDITDRFGENYGVEYYNGGYYILYANQPFSFFYRDPANIDGIRSDVPNPTDEIFIVMSGGMGVTIFGDVRIGSKLADLEAFIGETLEIEFNEMEGFYCASFIRDDIKFVVTLDDNNLITSCEVWDVAEE